MGTITSDPGFAGGYTSNPDVSDGLHRDAGIWALVGLSTGFWRTEF